MQPWLTVTGLTLDFCGVFILVKEWYFASLYDRSKALRSDIKFFRNLRHKFTPQEGENIQRQRRERELALARILAVTNDSDLMNKRAGLVRWGLMLVLLGFALQFLGAIPTSILCAGSAQECLPALLVLVIFSVAGTAYIAFLATGDIVRTTHRAKDHAFTGEFFSDMRSNRSDHIDLLWLNLSCHRGAIIGLTRPNSIDTPTDDGFLEILGAANDGIAEITITDYSSGEPYQYARVRLRSEGDTICWELLEDAIGNFPTASRLSRLN